MRTDFAIFILSHGRPDSLRTLATLRTAGYTGKVFIVIDDEDKTADQYVKKYGKMVVRFSKAKVEPTFDTGDNFKDRRSVIYARNACHDIARGLGLKYFMQLDDDYGSFFYRYNKRREYIPIRVRNLDALLSAMLKWYIDCPQITTLCMSQGGDHIGGGDATNNESIRALRKAMNSFLCAVDRPLKFVGRLNDDVNTYVEGSRRGVLFLTAMQVQLNQVMTQAQAGGLTDIYLSLGTYVKTFYSVMYCPSAVRVSVLGDPKLGHAGYYRIHHQITWDNTAPKILSVTHKKQARRATTKGKA